MANTKISALTALTNPTGNEELVYAYNNANGKMTLDTMKTFASANSQATLVSGVNIKTINNTSILGSGNIDVSGGGGGGGFEPTELGGDANIWELSEGVYVTTHLLYYKSGEEVTTALSSSASRKMMLFVAEDSNNIKSYFVFNVYSYSGGTNPGCYASFGYSASASAGSCNDLADEEWALKRFGNMMSSSINHPDALTSGTLSQIITNIDDDSTNDLRFSNSNPAYAGMTYTLYVASVASGKTYSITLGNGVTNPLNITLPSSSNKKCVITVLATSGTTGIVTGCTIES